MSRRLAICVVFYDNYKYGRKALCLEQLVRLFETLPLLATVHRRLFRLQKVEDLLHANTSLVRTTRTIRFSLGILRKGTEEREDDTRVDRSIKNLRLLSVALGGKPERVAASSRDLGADDIGYLHVKISAVRFKKRKKSATAVASANHMLTGIGIAGCHAG